MQLTNWAELKEEELTTRVHTLVECSSRKIGGYLTFVSPHSTVDVKFEYKRICVLKPQDQMVSYTLDDVGGAIQEVVKTLEGY